MSTPRLEHASPVGLGLLGLLPAVVDSGLRTVQHKLPNEVLDLERMANSDRRIQLYIRRRMAVRTGSLWALKGLRSKSCPLRRTFRPLLGSPCSVLACLAGCRFAVARTEVSEVPVDYPVLPVPNDCDSKRRANAVIGAPAQGSG